MSQTIWKQELAVDHMQKIAMPENARILKIGVQHGVPVMWYLWRDGDEEVLRTFVMFGTGSKIERINGRRLNYLDTVQIGSLVWHYFEEVPY